MSQSRRDFLKTMGVIGAGVTGLNSGTAQAAPRNILSDNRMGVLVDTTVCIGCRRCEYACKKAHGLPTEAMDDYNDRSVFEQRRRPTPGALTVVNEYEHSSDTELPINVKVQCMHCDYPACVSACIVGAFSKEENGSVIWDPGKCIGCRYCLVACPFQVPSFEYQKALQPEVRKCDFCFERTQAGKIPACVEICPMEVMTYGKRFELVELAHKRIRDNPDRYIDHVFGEHEVGGTAWLYLAGQNFPELDFPILGMDPAPGASESLQHAIFKYFIPPISLFALLGAIMWTGKNKKESE
ncbi:MAG: 4Fe-4S dicluster domain-containing protein [Calditrichaeota bacterium]|nr:4Fe-4S dicluster domain-containing protein [Calditrichota bacterium]MCB9090653.1 4Fe-4S dicluster domain-containing protein [Calditrichia bacterium]